MMQDVGISRVLDRIIAKARAKDWLSRDAKKSLPRERDFFLFNACIGIRGAHYRLTAFLLSKEVSISSLGAVRFPLKDSRNWITELEQLCALGEEIEEYWRDIHVVIDDEYGRVCDEVRSVSANPSALSFFGES